MIIGVAGLKGSGKDTVGQHLVREHGFEQRAFADKLKEVACALFEIDRDNIDYFKNDSTRLVGIFRESGFNMGGCVPFHPVKPITFRHFLQRLGTEAGRNIFGENFWVDQVLPHFNPEGFAFSKHYPEHLVITDVRFANECKRVHDLGGKVICLVRQTIPQLDDQHISEALDLDADIIIKNNDSKEALYKGVDAILKTWLNEHA